MSSDNIEIKFCEDGSVDLSDFRKSFSDVSRNDAGKSVVQSDHQVIFFDDVVKAHKKYRCYEGQFKSMDALYSEGKGKDIWLIEFKSGEVNAGDIKEKACHSLLIAMDLRLIESLADAKSRAHFVLVYKLGNRANLMRYSSGNPNEQAFPRALGNIRWLFHDAVSCVPEKFISDFIIPHYGALGMN